MEAEEIDEKCVQVANGDLGVDRDGIDEPLIVDKENSPGRKDDDEGKFMTRWRTEACTIDTASNHRQQHSTAMAPNPK